MGTTIRGLSSLTRTSFQTPSPKRTSDGSAAGAGDGFELTVAPKVAGVFGTAPTTETPPSPKIDVSTLQPKTVDTIDAVMGYEPGQLQVMLGSEVVKPELKTKLAMMITELELGSGVPQDFVRQVVDSGVELSDAVSKLGISEDTLTRLAQRYSTTPEDLQSGWAGFDDDKKASVLGDLFKLEHPPMVPIATIEELAQSNASLDTVKSALGVSSQSADLILELESASERSWDVLTPDRRMDLMAKMFRHENLIPAYEDVNQDERLAKLKAAIDADQNKPSFLSNLGDFALASLVNVVSDYVFFNAAKWKDPSQHGGQAVSMAYRVYQVALQAYSSLWLGANHGTGTSMAFWWNQWNAVNDFGYYGVATLADKLGIKPQGWDGADWPKAVFNDAQPPNWFSWTTWALTHPGEPTTGGNILSGAIGSTGTTLELLTPAANTPWRNGSGDSFFSKVGSWLSKLVPGRVF